MKNWRRLVRKEDYRRSISRIQLQNSIWRLEISSYENPGGGGILRCGYSQQAPGFSDQRIHRLRL